MGEPAQPAASPVDPPAQDAQASPAPNPGRSLKPVLRYAATALAFLSAVVTFAAFAYPLVRPLGRPPLWRLVVANPVRQGLPLDFYPSEVWLGALLPYLAYFLFFCSAAGALALASAWRHPWATTLALGAVPVLNVVGFLTLAKAIDLHRPDGPGRHTARAVAGVMLLVWAALAASELRAVPVLSTMLAWGLLLAQTLFLWAVVSGLVRLSGQPPGAAPPAPSEAKVDPVPAPAARPSSGMSCPDCGGGLEEGSSLGGCDCPGCHGTLLPALALGRLLQLTGTSGDTFRQLLKVAEPAKGKCPSCAAEPRQILLKGAAGSVCTTCRSMWVRGSALFVMTAGKHGVARAVSRPAAQALETSPAPPGSSGAWLAALVLLGGTGVIGPALWVAVHASEIKCPSGTHKVRMTNCEAVFELQQRCEDEAGRAQGPSATRSFQGALLARDEYADGKLDGISRRWFPDGRALAEGRYLKGNKQGRWVQRAEDGSRTEADYEAGVLDGPYASFRADGAVSERGAYKAGKKHGPWKLTGADGAVAEEYWDQGKPAKPKSAEPVAGSPSSRVLLPDRDLYGGRPASWWESRLMELQVREDDEAKRVLALTRERATRLGLSVVESEGRLTIERLNAEAR